MTKVITREYRIEPGAFLQGTDLRGADLRGADLANAEVTEEQLAEAITDETTKGI